MDSLPDASILITAVPDPQPQIGPSNPQYIEGHRQYRYSKVAERYPPKTIKIRDGMIALSKPQGRFMKLNEDPRPQRPQLRDYEVVRTLGSGGYGFVAAVRTKTRVQPGFVDEYAQMALKAFNKRAVREYGKPAINNSFDLHPQENYKNTELRHLASLPWSPFIANLYDIYSDTKNLYLLTEVGLMGTLSGYITRNAPLPTSQCQFFCGNIILAVEFIHKQGLVHGDVKADNLFMGADGYLMLGDLGMARRHDIDDAQWRRIGTMQFIPPEFIIDLPIDKENRRHIDWWGLACILYEMATGRLTFPHCRRRGEPRLDTKAGDDELKMRITEVSYTWPRDIEVDSNLKDLVDRMLKKVPGERYGMTKIAEPSSANEKTRATQGTSTQLDWKNQQIRQHPFMLFFPWNLLSDRKCIAPYVPREEPDMTMGWQAQSFPPQCKLPFLSRKEPARHFQWDDRFKHRSLAKRAVEDVPCAPRPAKRTRLEELQPDEDQIQIVGINAEMEEHLAFKERKQKHASYRKQARVRAAIYVEHQEQRRMEHLWKRKTHGTEQQRQQLVQRRKGRANVLNNNPVQLAQSGNHVPPPGPSVVRSGRERTNTKREAHPRSAMPVRADQAQAGASTPPASASSPHELESPPPPSPSERTRKLSVVNTAQLAVETVPTDVPRERSRRGERRRIPTSLASTASPRASGAVANGAAVTKDKENRRKTSLPESKSPDAVRPPEAETSP